MSSTIKLNEDAIQVQVVLQGDEPPTLAEMAEEVQQLACQMLGAWVKAVQQSLLEEALGAPWKPLPAVQRSLGCPRCGSVALRRKGWRSRTIRLADLGAVQVPRRQLVCTDCGRHWMPFEQPLALPGGCYGPQIAGEALDRVTEMSYQKAADSLEDGPSATSLHRIVQACPQLEEARKARTAAVDGTDVPAWKSPGQISLSLAHEIGPASGRKAPNGRPAPRRRRVLAIAAGREADIEAKLDPIDLQGMVHDGKLQLEGQATHQGRCRWHVPYTVRHLLYRDEIIGEDNKARVAELRQRMAATHWGAEALGRHVRRWLDDNRQQAPTACRHVRRSLEGLQQMAKHPEAFTVQTTSHIEREMVEINKRFENGGGWTPQGAESLLRLHQLRRHEPKRYESLKQKLIERTVFLN